jgi:SAM-dependent methyltransferase
MAEKIRSYTSTGGSIGGQLRQLRDLVRGARHANRNISGGLDYLVTICRQAEEAYERQTGEALRNLRALEIGPGQALGQMLYFAQKNDVVGVDLDYIGTGPLKYWRVLRFNGPKRLIKTIGRDLLVSDKEFRQAFAQRLGVSKLKIGRVMRMDAAKMSFPDASFDFVYSFTVFEHIPDPRAVLREIRRVLKPGGVVYTNVHLFTCDSGFHDLRIIAQQRQGIPYWAHLRPAHRHEVSASSYLNELRLDQWHAILNQELPGGEISYVRDEELRPELERIRAAGELSEYADDELLIQSINSAWRKPITS